MHAWARPRPAFPGALDEANALLHRCIAKYQHGPVRARGVARVPKIAIMQDMVVSETSESRRTDQPSGAVQPCDPTPVNGRRETLVRVGKKEFCIPDQVRGWVVPAALRGDAIAELWRIIRSRRIKADVKIRAIEALVRLDNQALQERRHDDWRDVQTTSTKRANVRVLAELARQRSLPTKAPRPGKSERKP